MVRLVRWGGLGAALCLLAGCQSTMGSSTPDGGVDSGPAACPISWTGRNDGEPRAGLVHVVDGALVLEASSDGVVAETTLTEHHTPGSVRLELTRLSLGAGGKLTVRFGTFLKDDYVETAIFDVTPTLARVQMNPHDPVRPGLTFTLALDAEPTRAVLEHDTLDDGQHRIRVFFYGAGRSQVLTASDATNQAYANDRMQVELVGLSARAVIDRHTLVRRDGTIEAVEFDCDCLGAFVPPAWPSARAGVLGATCAKDAECGAADRCVDGRCRRPCLASSGCFGSMCLVGPDGGFCRLPDEMGCNPSCPAGLVCGPDSTCRRPCTGGRAANSSDLSDLAGTCPLNYVSTDFGGVPNEIGTMRCVHGACADDTEPGAIAAGGWGCGYGTTLCSNDRKEIQVCNQTGPGFQRVESCNTSSCVYVCPSGGEEYQCKTGTTSPAPRCLPCPRVCERGEDVIDYCLPGPSQVAIDCETGFSFCSNGPGGDLARKKPGDLPLLNAICEPVVAPVTRPAPIRITPPAASGVKGFGIDPTEVSRAEYVAFLQTRPSVAGQPAICAINNSFLPGIWPDVGDWPWFERPNRPALVDWCDAAAYCRWAGGHLCGALGAGTLAPGDVGAPSKDAWAYACTSGGTRQFPYGDTVDAAACAPLSFPYADVGTSAKCTSDVAGFSGVFDLAGNASEWLDACSPATSGGAANDACALVSGSPCSLGGARARSAAAGAIRCCYD